MRAMIPSAWSRYDDLIGKAEIEVENRHGGPDRGEPEKHGELPEPALIDTYYNC